MKALLKTLICLALAAFLLAGCDTSGTSSENSSYGSAPSSSTVGDTSSATVSSEEESSETSSEDIEQTIANRRLAEIWELPLEKNYVKFHSFFKSMSIACEGEVEVSLPQNSTTEEYGGLLFCNTDSSDEDNIGVIALTPDSLYRMAHKGDDPSEISVSQVTLNGTDYTRKIGECIYPRKNLYSYTYSTALDLSPVLIGDEFNEFVKTHEKREEMEREFQNECKNGHFSVLFYAPECSEKYQELFDGIVSGITVKEANFLFYFSYVDSYRS